MRIKSGYMLREVAGHHVVLPLGSRVVEFNGVITLNGTGAFLWENMATEITEEALTDKLTAEYDIDVVTAKSDIQEFLAILKDKKLLEPEQ